MTDDRTYFNIINEPNANVSSLKIRIIFLVRQCWFHRFHDFMCRSKRSNGHFICNYLLKIDKLKETIYPNAQLLCRHRHEFSHSIWQPDMTRYQVKGRKIPEWEKNVVEKEAISSVKQAGGFVIIWFANYYFELMALTTTEMNYCLKVISIERFPQKKNCLKLKSYLRTRNFIVYRHHEIEKLFDQRPVYYFRRL